MKSAFVPALPDELVALCVESLARAPAGTDSGFSVWACGRAIARVPDEATAFTGRDGEFWLAAEALWHDPARDAECRPWAREAMAGVQPYASEGRYVNDVVETDEGLARTIYGAGEVRPARRAEARVGPGQRLPAQPEHPALARYRSAVDLWTTQPRRAPGRFRRLRRSSSPCRSSASETPGRRASASRALSRTSAA